MRKFVFAIILVWAATAGLLIWSKQSVLTQGATVLLQTEPVDPRDLLRGDYVVLNYKISQLDLSQLSPEGTRLMRDGDTIFVKLVPAGRFWSSFAVCPRQGCAGEGVYIRGKVKHSWRGQTVTYGIESYFVPEGEGRRLEEAMRGRRSEVIVEAAIGKDGRALIKHVDIEPAQEPEPRQPVPQAPRPPRVIWRPPVPYNTVTIDTSRTEKPPSCPDGLCGYDESCLNCPEDCGTIIYPYAADVESCHDSTGKMYATSGEGAARWFSWGGCGRQKEYRVAPYKPLVFYAFGDDCDSCVCYHADFTVWELANGQWQPKKRFDLPDEPGLAVIVPYTPHSDSIRIAAESCFYLDVYKEKE